MDLTPVLIVSGVVNIVLYIMLKNTLAANRDLWNHIEVLDQENVILLDSFRKGKNDNKS